MNCPNCKSMLFLKFNPYGEKRGQFFWNCSNSTTCNYSDIFIPKFKQIFQTKGFGYIIGEKLKNLSGQDKEDLILEIRGQMLNILEHYVTCRIGYCYSSIFRYILIDYLEDVIVLEYFLKSNSIKDGPLPICISKNGVKIFYDLFYDFMLVKSVSVKIFLQKEFPYYYRDFQNKLMPKEKYEFVDYVKNVIIK